MAYKVKVFVDKLACIVYMSMRVIVQGILYRSANSATQELRST